MYLDRTSISTRLLRSLKTGPKATSFCRGIIGRRPLPQRHLLLNVGVARCGTTAAWYFFQSLPGCTTPRDVKELNYLTGHGHLADYAAQFSDPDANVFAECSPNYLAGGSSRVELVLERIAALKEAGWQVTVLILVRNLLKRAFSHYWHDIGKQHAIFGRGWSVTDPADPRRLQWTFDRSFRTVLADKRLHDKLLPDIASHLTRLIAVLGPDNVFIGHTASMETTLADFLVRAAPEIVPLDEIDIPRVPGSRAAVYISGGKSGRTVEIDTETGPALVDIPPDQVLLMAGRWLELLMPDEGASGEPGRLPAELLERTVAASEKWTRQQDVRELPAFVFDHLARQSDAIAGLPATCFLAGQREALLEDLTRMPETLSVAPPKLTLRGLELTTVPMRGLA